MQNTLQWLIFGILFLSGVALLGLAFFRRKSESEIDWKGPRHDENAEKAMRDLGIVEVKPMGNVKTMSIQEATPVHVPTPEPAPAPKPKEEKSSGFQAKPLMLHPNSKQEVFAPLAQSLKAAIKAHSVFLVSRTEDGFPIEAAYSTSQHFTKSARLAPNARIFREVWTGSQQPITLNMAKLGLDSESLGFYKKQVSISEIAVVPVMKNGIRWGYWVADRAEGNFSSKDLNRMLEFTHLTEDILSEKHATPEIQPDLSIQSHDNRPRKELIADAMQYAFDTHKPLAFALVRIHDEAMKTQTEREVEETESMMQAGLTQLLGDKGNVEPFGKLIKGVFYFGKVNEAEKWAETVLGALSQSLHIMPDNISIGIVQMRERHRQPEDVLDEAKQALIAVHKTGGIALCD